MIEAYHEIGFVVFLSELWVALTRLARQGWKWWVFVPLQRPLQRVENARRVVIGDVSRVALGPHVQRFQLGLPWSLVGAELARMRTWCFQLFPSVRRPLHFANPAAGLLSGFSTAVRRGHSAAQIRSAR